MSVQGPYVCRGACVQGPYVCRGPYIWEPPLQYKVHTNLKVVVLDKHSPPSKGRDAH